MPEQISIEEGNKLIAEFMGWTFSKSSDAGILGGSIIYWKNPDTGHVGYSHPNNYHCSWNSLMPVVEKIKKTFVTGNNEHFHWNTLINGALHLVRIDYLWNEVIQFIQWYNNSDKT